MIDINEPIMHTSVVMAHPTEEGMTVIGHGGVSVNMSKEDFDNLYTKPHKGKSFWEAVQAMRMDCFAARADWEQGEFMWIKPKTRISPEMCHDSKLKASAEKRNWLIGAECFQCQKASVVFPFVPTVEDILSDDWHIFRKA